MWKDMNLSFAKNIGKNLSNKYSQKIIDTAKKSETDTIKTVSQWAIQKTAEATGDLVGNKIADKITSISKKSTKKLSAIDEDTESSTRKKIYIYIAGRKTTNYWWIKFSA